MQKVNLEVTMTLHPVDTEVARALLAFSQDFAALHNLHIQQHDYTATSTLELSMVGSSELVIKLFLTLHTMQQVEQRYAVPA